MYVLGLKYEVEKYGQKLVRKFKKFYSAEF